MVTVPVGERSLALVDFLSTLLEPTDDQELVATKSTFVAGGLAAVKAARTQRWIQLGLARPSKELYSYLAATARDLLDSGEIENFSYIKKDPGLRIRFSAKPEKANLVKDKILKGAQPWRSKDLLDPSVPGTYEPEDVLFGGPDSMSYVHRLFTIDSLTWLDYYAGDHEASPNWAVSLLTLRSLFSGLYIDGWESQAVWAMIRDIGRRRLPDVEVGESVVKVNNELRRWWLEPSTLLEQLPKNTGELVTKHADLALEAARKWSGYFSTEEANVGPRKAACYYVIFHWNRAGLSLGRQALIAEALAVEQ